VEGMAKTAAVKLRMRANSKKIRRSNIHVACFKF
jgi:hypothetical protein